MARAPARPATPLDLWRDINSYWLDFTQRSVLFWDTLRQRGNNWLEREGRQAAAAGFRMGDDRGCPQVRAAGELRARADHPAGRVEIDPDRRPFVIIDPRAGHGPGIGGFKQDSQVGVALKAGHPVYFVIFFPSRCPGRPWRMSRAPRPSSRIVGKRHPNTRKPVVIGNCQGVGLCSSAPSIPTSGPIVINGAPMSYWAGNDGENPMRYAGGMLGGVWPRSWRAISAPASSTGRISSRTSSTSIPPTRISTSTTTSSRRSTPSRSASGIRALVGRLLPDGPAGDQVDRREPVRRQQSAGRRGRMVGGTRLRPAGDPSPIILFASLGDNITPPQQAFNWVADLYPTTEALKANGQVIVGLMHKSVGHLGIFVSGRSPSASTRRSST